MTSSFSKKPMADVLDVDVKMQARNESHNGKEFFFHLRENEKMVQELERFKFLSSLAIFRYFSLLFAFLLNRT